MRKLFGWILGVVVFLALALLFRYIGQLVDVRTYVHFDDPETISNFLYEDEISGGMTFYGYGTTLVSILLAARTGMAFYAGRFSWGGTEKGRLAFLAWLVGSALFSVLGAVSVMSFHGARHSISPYFQLFIQVAFTALIVWICKGWYTRRAAKVDQEKGSLPR